MKAFETFRYPADVRFLAFEELPSGKDLFIISSAQIDELKRQWERYLAEPDGAAPPHPNGFLDHRWCAVETLGPDSCEVNLEITTSTRWHGVIETLPRTKFVGCVKFWNYEKRAYVIVDSDWFDDIERVRFSLYALVDVVGMRALLSRQGRIEPRQLAALKSEIDDLATAHPDHAFLTLADNVLVKTNWSARGADYAATYRPEGFLALVSKVRSALRRALGLDSYCVVTQGSDRFADAVAVTVSARQNHVFFGSLGTPFAELFDIDRAAHQAIRGDAARARSLYLARSFFLSLNFKDYAVRDQLMTRLTPFESKLSVPDERAYLAVEEEHLLPLLSSDGAHLKRPLRQE